MMLSRRSAQILLLVVVLLAGLLFLATPLLIKHFALQWLRDNGGEQVSVEAVALNPFTGRLELRGLEVKVDDTTTLAFDSAEVNAAWWPLLHKQLELQSLALHELTLVIDRRAPQPRIGGIRLPEPKDEPQADNPWSAGLDTLVLHDVKLRYLDDQLDLTLDLKQLQLDRLAQWTPETATPIEAQGSLNQASFQLRGEIAPLAKRPRYDLRLQLDALPLAPFARLLAQPTERLAGALSYDGKLHYEQQPGDGFELRHSGALRLQALDLALRQPALAIKTQSARLDSELAVTRTSQAQFQLSGEVQAEGLDVATLDGALQLLASDKLRIAGLKVAAADDLSFEKLEADQLTLAHQPGKVPVTLLRAGKLDLGKLALKDRRLRIDTIRLKEMTNQLYRDADGTWQAVAIGKRISALGEPAAKVKAEVDAAVTTPKEAAQGEGESGATDAAAGEASDDSTPPQGATQQQTPAGEPQPTMTFRIGKIAVEGESHVKLRDDAIKPGLDTDIAIKTLQLESLDSGAPEQPSPFELKATVDTRTDLSVQGTLRPFLRPPGGDLEARIRALDLPPLSPYARASLGLNLKSGTLDADIDLKSDSDKLDGRIKLDLYRLGVENTGGDNSLQSRLPVPINVALDTLRDGNDTISLKIPVSGNPAKPDFDIDNLIAKALADGLQKGTLTYLTLALQPYGAIVMAARYAGEQINKVRLNPVTFAAGKSDLDDQARDYLSKVAKVMDDRPKLTVKVCGVAVNDDLAYLKQQNAAAAQNPSTGSPGANPSVGGNTTGGANPDATANSQQVTPAEAYQAQLGKLAERRANSVRDYLVNKYKTKASHLVSCQPRIETATEGASKPRTDLLL